MGVYSEYITPNFKSIEYYKGEESFVKTIEEKGRPLKWYIDKELANRNQAIRDHFECFVSITSGIRSIEHNQRLIDEGYNASSVSQHMFQRASDIQVYKIVDGKKQFISATEIIQFLKSNFDYGAIGAVNDHTVHHDTRNADGWIDIKY